MSTSLEIGQKVRVHKNLHRGDWSITVRGRVVAHVASICFADVTFKIRETARLQVIERRCRQVHAWCEGVVCALPQGDRTPITYNLSMRLIHHAQREASRALRDCPYDD